VAWLDRVFRPREIFIRVDGRVRYLTLSVRVQKLAALAVVGIGLWTSVATTGLFVQEFRLGGKDNYIAAQESRYANLLAEIATYHARYAEIARELERNQGIALSTLDGGTPAEPGPDADAAVEGEGLAVDGSAPNAARAQLSARLSAFEVELRQAAERNMALKERVAEITGILSGAAVARLGVGERQGQVESAPIYPGPAASTRSGPDVDQTGVPKAALDRIAALTEDRRRLAWALAESEIGVANLALERGGFEAAIAQNNDALQAAEERYDALSTGRDFHFEELQKERDDLRQQVTELTSHLAELDQRNIRAVTRLSDAAADAASRLEKTIDMTGLSADDLLRRQSNASAQGGPYFEDIGEIDLSGSAGSELSLALDLLNMKLDRWKALQGLMRAVPLAPPLEQFEISSHFGTRFDPLNSRKARHYGMDFRAPRNASVYATAPGKVIYAGWYGQFGRLVEIDHGYGIKTRYAHLNEIHVKRGQVVTSQQKIGTLGTSGRSTGPHVHYEVLFNNKPQNPAKFLTAGQNVFKR
jgi:murein DD-endopeptidase MepM/ murein hydrolase activator NlpD